MVFVRIVRVEVPQAAPEYVQIFNQQDLVGILIQTIAEHTISYIRSSIEYQIVCQSLSGKVRHSQSIVKKCVISIAKV